MSLWGIPWHIKHYSYQTRAKRLNHINLHWQTFITSAQLRVRTTVYYLQKLALTQSCIPIDSDVRQHSII